MSRHYSAFVNDVLGTSDATSITEMIHRGDIALDEAIDAAIKRAQASRAILNAVVIDDFERVKSRAKNLLAAKRRSVAHQRLNTPAFLKDNLHLEGLPTRFGSNATSPQPSAVTDDLVHQLQACGLHFIGKSTTPPFGFGCSTEFDDGSAPTRNPWNLDLSAGGSSGGSAALVAAGVVPIAHGNDGGGSIRIPAALCGLVGLKPSRGRLIYQKKSKAMPIDIISDGVLTRTVRDTANFYHDAERYFQPKGLKPIGLVEGPSKKRLRIGFVYDSILTKACPQTRLTLESTAKLLSELGHYVEETTFQSEDRFAQDFTLYWSFLAFMVDVFGKAMLSGNFDRKKLDGLTRGLSKNFRDRTWAALKAIRYLRNAANQPLFKTWRYDVILSPVLARTAPELGYLNPGVPFDTLLSRLQEYVGYTPLANVIGNTAISLPMGQSTSGAPIGMQLSAPTGEERQLLELAFELETAKPWPFLFARPSS
jgi:amidase